MYLILHTVRGKPAFDIAEPMKIGDEDGWIIPTSGHRAYPVRTWSLEDLADVSDINERGQHSRPINYQDVNEVRDHYEWKRDARQEKIDIVALLDLPKEPFRRRI